MYNNYTRDTQAWWAMKEAIQVENELEDAVGAMASTFENIIDELDTACQERDDAEEERDQAQTDLEELQKKFDEFESEKFIELLKELRNAATTMATYCEAKLRKIDVQEGADDSSDGAAGDGGSEDIL